MSRQKKSRKVGTIGVKKSPTRPTTPAKVKKSWKKPSGKPAGSRHSATEVITASRGPQKKDPRVGSKKPIDLFASNSPKKEVKKKYYSPAEELAAIEQDVRLEKLLDTLDSGTRLSLEEQAYVDQKMARHQILCDLLGIKPEDEEQTESQIDEEDDLLTQYDKADLSKYR